MGRLLSIEHTPTAGLFALQSVCKKGRKMANSMEVLPRCPSCCVGVDEAQETSSPVLLAGLPDVAVPKHRVET